MSMQTLSGGQILCPAVDQLFASSPGSQQTRADFVAVIPSDALAVLA